MPLSERSIPAWARGVLFFLCCMLVGVGLRASERVAHAWGLDAECYAEVWGEFVEVRRVAGDGPIDGQMWPRQLLLDLTAGTLGLFEDRPAEEGYEEHPIDAETT